MSDNSIKQILFKKENLRTTAVVACSLVVGAYFLVQILVSTGMGHMEEWMDKKDVADAEAAERITLLEKDLSASLANIDERLAMIETDTKWLITLFKRYDLEVN